MIQNQMVAMEKQLQQIADMLLLNGTLTECPGLVHGKMGIATFFFHYAQKTDNMLFADYAMDLIGETLNQIHVNSPANYENGLAGIGVGINYMIQNNFLDVEDDICEDFDSRMIRAVLYDPWEGFSQYNGLIGYGRYWMTRLRYQEPAVQARECLPYIIAQIEENVPNISITDQTDVLCFLHEMQKIAGFERCGGLFEQYRKEWDIPLEDISNCFPRLGDSITGNRVRIYQHRQYFNAFLSIETNVEPEQIPALDMEKVPTSMGLLTGYAGEGLLRMTALRQTNDAWMFLL